jgi:hypothetical protein
MTKQQFIDFWAENYPESQPINYLLGIHLQDNWLRIHSLPESKRYANTKEEWDILLSRQNTVIDDLIPQGSDIHVVINWIDPDHFLFRMFNFNDIGIFTTDDGETIFQSYSFETTWETNGLNPLLIEIADDQIRAFIIGKDCLISPYDGGMDIYYKDVQAKYLYKEKYKNWLSKRWDGM